MATNNGSLDLLKQHLGPGARANKYRIYLTIPTAAQVSGITDEAIDVLVQTAGMPDKTIGQIDVWTQGRKLPLPGDTSYSNTWNVTAYNSEDQAFRRSIIKWMQAIDNFQANLHAAGDAYSDLLVTAKICQLDSHGNETVTYTMHNLYPNNIGEVSMGDDQADTISTFDVTFCFSDWVVGDGALDNPDSAGTPSTGNALS